MAHKYLSEIIDLKNTPYGYSENTGRDKKWSEEREKFGFDERETWSLDISFFCWLYERLRMFKDIAGIKLDFYEFNINENKMTQIQCIDRMIELCEKIIINKDINDMSKERNEILDIWKECINVMWW